MPVVNWSLYLLRSWLLLCLLHRYRATLGNSRGPRCSRWSLSLSHGTRSRRSKSHTMWPRWSSRSSRHLHLMRSCRCTRGNWRSRSRTPRTSRHTLRGLLKKLRLARLSWLTRLNWVRLPLLLLLKHGSLRMTSGHHRGLLDIYHLKPLRRLLRLLDLRLRYWYSWGSTHHWGSRLTWNLRNR